VPRRLQSHARAECLETIVAWLVGQEVSTTVIESRGVHNDQQDRQTIIECRRAGHQLGTHRFARAVDEPLLWVADVVAGATSAHLDGSNHRWFQPIHEKVTILTPLGP